MKYDSSRPLIGATGATHDSAAEAHASFRLAHLGIMPCPSAYPITFRDRDGVTFVARSDFKHEASGVWFEYKASNLNSKTTKATADKAEARVIRDEALGFVNDRNRLYKLLQAQWCHSVHKQAAVVKALTPARVVLLLKHEPGEEEAKRLSKAGIFWRTLGNVSVFALYLRLAAQGLDVGFTAQARPGSSMGPWHAFGSVAEAA
jgi:hypothetical protein